MGYELSEARKNCMSAAGLLGDYQAYTVNDLADGYCDALDNEDESLKNAYISALILRFWYKIDELKQECASLNLDYDDAFNWIAMAIMQACEPKNRAWQKNNTNAQTAIFQTLNTRFKAAAYYESNLDIHKANYNNMSLDEQCNDDGNESFIDTMEDEYAKNSQSDIEAITIVQDFLKHDKLVEAIIIDNIAFSEAQKIKKETVKLTDPETGEVKRYTSYNREFWPYKLVQTLNELPDNYKNYFLKRYSVNSRALDAAIDSIKSCDNSKLYKSITNTLNTLKLTMLGA